MTAPALAARYFGIACVLGVELGMIYGFLRPLRPRFTVLADTVFVLAAFRMWLVLGLVLLVLAFMDLDFLHSYHQIVELF